MKIFKFDNCYDCRLQTWERRQLKCPIKEANGLSESFRKDSIHKDCPLEDYQQQKTEWLPISEMTENDKEYRLLDENNVVGVGHQEHDRLIIYNPDKTPENIGIPVMFAEIKGKNG